LIFHARFVGRSKRAVAFAQLTRRRAADSGQRCGRESLLLARSTYAFLRNSKSEYEESTRAFNFDEDLAKMHSFLASDVVA
jgi:hypothetical protein